MKTIDEKAWDYSDSRRKDADLTDIATAFHDGYIQGATEALQSQWRKFPTDADGLADSEAIDIIALPILVRYQDGYVFAVNHDWGEEAEWYNDILNHPNRYAWMPIPKYEPNKSNGK